MNGGTRNVAWRRGQEDNWRARGGGEREGEERRGGVG